MQPVPEGIFFGSQAELDVLGAGLGYTADAIQFMPDISPEGLAVMMRQLDIIKTDIEAGRALGAAIFGNTALSGKYRTSAAIAPARNTAVALKVL